VPLTELLDLVNEVSAQLLPVENDRDSRVSRVFTPRSFRHYQTLGCIDAPMRDGKRAVYGLRHFLQALLVRKLLWERVPSERIVALMECRSTTEIRQMLIEKIEMVTRVAVGEGVSGDAPCVAETWKRVVVVPGVELHLRGDLPKPRPREMEELLGKLETALRKGIG
jgi:DNA-binding transcriptional MerR regulator